MNAVIEQHRRTADAAGQTSNRAYRPDSAEEGPSDFRERLKAEWVQQTFRDVVNRDPDAFRQAVGKVLGDDIDRHIVDRLIDAALADRPMLPPLRFVDMTQDASTRASETSLGSIDMDRALVVDEDSVLERYTQLVGQQLHGLSARGGDAGVVGANFARAMSVENFLPDSAIAMNDVRSVQAGQTLLAPSLADYGTTREIPVAPLANLRAAMTNLPTVDPLQVELAANALNADIQYRLTYADSKTDFKRLTDLQNNRAILTLTGSTTRPDGVSGSTLTRTRTWMDAATFEDLGLSRAPTLTGSASERFANVWLGSTESERLALLGITDRQWNGASAVAGGAGNDPLKLGGANSQAAMAHRFSEISRELDRGFFDHLTEFVTKPFRDIGELDIPVLSDLAHMSDNFVAGSVDLLELAAQSPSNVADGLREDGLDGGLKASLADLSEAIRTGAEATWANVATVTNVFIEEVDRTFNQIDRRGLSTAEKTEMRRVFGESIDYDAVVISTGGARSASGMASNVIGNSMHLGDRYQDGDVFVDKRGGTLTPKGYELLAHEMTHIWQYQKNGAGYMGESLVGSRPNIDDAYDWVKGLQEGKTFLEMNVEQQGDVAEMIYEVVSQLGELSRENFNNVYTRYPERVGLTANEFDRLLDAAFILRT